VKPTRVLSGLALAGAAVALQGCVVAAAAPLAATGFAIVKGKRETPRTPMMAVPTPASNPAPSLAASPVPQRALAPLPSPENSRIVLTGLSEMPAPTARDIGISDGTILSFARHALARAEADPANAATRSAVLAAPGALETERAACRDGPAMVLIDLDPGREAFDPLAPSRTDPALVDALARLREGDVVIAWQTHLGDNFADLIRATLADTGLDPTGTDRIETLGSLDERKQTRRDALARTHCIVAILGDERSDFDELYLYLKDRDAVVPPDAMIGNGWFLASPVTNEG
jgi:hypothetical protein